MPRRDNMVDNKDDAKHIDIPEITEEDYEDVCCFPSRFKELDEAFKIAQERKMPMVHVIDSLPGFFATKSALDWLEKRKYNCIVIDAPSLKITQKEVEYEDWDALFNGSDVAIVGKIEPPIVKKTLNVIFSDKQIDAMSEPNKIVFIDDYDMADYAVRKELRKLYGRSFVVDLREEDNGYRKNLDNIIFFIIRVHPVRYYGDPYDEQEEEWFGKQTDCRK